MQDTEGKDAVAVQVRVLTIREAASVNQSKVSIGKHAI